MAYPITHVLFAVGLLLLAGFTIGWYWTAAVWLASLAIVVQMFFAALKRDA